MKKYFFVLIVFSLFFISCNKNELQTENLSEDAYFIYDINENIESLDIDENGVLYYKTLIKDENDTFKCVIKALDFDGSVINTYEIEKSPAHISVRDGSLYYVVHEINGLCLYKYTLDGNESVKLTDITNYSDIIYMTVIADKLYFLGVNNKYINKDYTPANPDDMFSYSGEAIACIDLNTLSCNELAIDLPIAFSKAPDDNILIYAYDEEGGYYLTEYNTKDGSFSEKTYHKIEMINKFAVYNDKKDFVYQKSRDNTLILVSASIDPAKGETDLLPGVNGGAHLLCHNGYIYCTNFDTTKITRINAEAFMQNNKKITLICSDIYDYNQPFGCGYTIKQNILSDEEMALALLSQDKSFDICFINSGQEISENIKSKGSFYPLNKVEGVQEYLDACFPYIREAATNSDGDIWMLPIAVDMPVIFYNEAVCKENDISLKSSLDFDEFISILKRFNEDKNFSDLYYYDWVDIVNNFFDQYLSNSKDFNSDGFRRLADNIKSVIKYSESRMVGNYGLLPEFYSNTNRNYAFFFIDDHDFQYKAADRENIRACSLPNIAGNKSNMTKCFFFCVNPESKNLKETLKYISSYCEYIMSRKELMIFKDRSLYPQTAVMDDLYGIYSNGSIQFTYPKELFMDDFNAYLRGEKELDDFIKESNRRLDVYLNE